MVDIFPPMAPWRVMLSFAAVAILLAGCGGGSDPTGETADSPAGAAIEAGSSAEREEAVDVQKYLERNCAPPGTIDKVPEEELDGPNSGALVRNLEGMEAMCGQIAVEGTRVTIRSEIEPGVRRGAGEAFCNPIRGSDVADETPGHELRNIDGSTIAVCPVGDDPPEFR